MGIFDWVKKIRDRCANCDHSEIAHMTRKGYRDEQRQNWSSMEQFPSECRECVKEGKICKEFKKK